MTRQYGSGTVFQRSDGMWVGQWEMNPVNGRRRRGSRVRPTEAAVRKAMREAQGSSSRSRRRTESVGEFLDRWLADVVVRTRRERTFVGYQAIVAAVPRSVTDLDVRDPGLSHVVQAWLNRIDRHPRTVRHYAACLRTAFAYAVRKGLTDRNPAIDVDLPAIPRAERIPLTTAELRRLLDVDDPLRPLWVTAAWTGMRQGELLGLRWEDVDLDRGSLVVRRSLSRLPARRGSGTRYVLTEPKTDRSRRTIPLLPDVVAALRAVRKGQLERPGKLDQGLVFCTEAGSPLDASVVSHAFVQAVTAAALPRIRMHDLRHGAASMLIERGVDLATVAAILGHSNIGTTVDLYGHLTEGHKVAAIARLAEVG